MRKTFVGTSWKMNKTVKEGITYLQELIRFIDTESIIPDEVEVFVIPTFLSVDAFTGIVKEKRSALKIGAQDCCWEDEGPFTGEVSPMHLKDLGAEYIELGHAERRRYFCEDDEMINKKVRSTLRNGLKPILCIGEQEKYEDINTSYIFLERQLMGGLKDVKDIDLKNLIIAYEPVWAIGASSSAPIEYIGKVLDFLRSVIDKNFKGGLGKSQAIIYGGSVNMESVRQILSLKNNDGIFVGRSALNIDYFKDMIKTALQIRKDT
jgi:triosephosphate isomerase